MFASAVGLCIYVCTGKLFYSGPFSPNHPVRALLIIIIIKNTDRFSLIQVFFAKPRESLCRINLIGVLGHVRSPHLRFRYHASLCIHHYSRQGVRRGPINYGRRGSFIRFGAAASSSQR